MSTAENGGIRLRPLEPEDLELAYTIENDTSTWDASGNPVPFSRYALRRYLEAAPADIFQQHELRLVVCLKADGRAIGFVDLVNFSPYDRRAELSIAILREYRRHGYGREALAALERYAARFCHIRTLFAQVSHAGNAASHRLLTDSGYTVEATLTDWHHTATGYEAIDILKKNIEKAAETFGG